MGPVCSVPTSPTMTAVPITLTISLGLAATFVILYLRERSISRAGGAERDSLLPLSEEQRRPVGERAAGPPAGAGRV
jgi:hypothetical protein